MPNEIKFLTVPSAIIISMNLMIDFWTETRLEATSFHTFQSMCKLTHMQRQPFPRADALYLRMVLFFLHNFKPTQICWGAPPRSKADISLSFKRERILLHRDLSNPSFWQTWFSRLLIFSCKWMWRKSSDELQRWRICRKGVDVNDIHYPWVIAAQLHNHFGHNHLANPAGAWQGLIPHLPTVTARR